MSERKPFRDFRKSNMYGMLICGLLLICIGANMNSGSIIAVGQFTSRPDKHCI